MVCWIDGLLIFGVANIIDYGRMHAEKLKIKLLSVKFVGK
jgi:hypothetical protein